MSQSADTDAIKKDLETLKGDIQSLATSFRENSERRVRDGMDQARDKYDDLRDQAGRKSKELGAEIESRPFTSVLVAFGAGLVLGKLIGR